VADPSGGTAASQVYTGSTPASFAVQGTDGVVKVITLNSGNNSLNGLASAINASGAGVSANIVNTGSGATPYQLVLTATNTGTGSTGGVVSLADVTSNNGTSTDNQLGIAAGKVDSLTTPTTISGGLQSAAATNAVFSVDGVQLTRQTNTVTDAVNGLTLSLLQGGQTGTTALTVAEDTSTITTTLQSVVTSYNQLLNDYTVASTATKDASGNIVSAPLSNDSTARNLLAQIQSVFTSIPAGMPSSATYQSVGDLGITTNSDGTLALNTSTLTTALQNNPDAAQNVFDFTGTTTNGVVNFNQGTAQTTALKIAFNITNYNGNTGAWSGTMSADGGAAVSVSGGKNQPVTGVDGTSMEGIQLDVTGEGSGTLSLTTGVAQATQNAVASMTGYQGPIWNTVQALANDSTSLTTQIASEQNTLTNIQNQLELQFANMEATVSQLKTASGGLASLGS
jgi:flagellar hook-associated protein 2